MNVIRFFLCGILLVGYANVYGQTYNFTSPQGYGAGTTGGGSASPKTVTSQSALQSAMTASGSAVILVSGTISCSYMSVLVNNKTIIGLPGAKLVNLDQTTTGSGIINLKPGSSNVIFRNLIFVGPGAYDTGGRDLLCLSGGLKVWVDHCEFQDGCDGNLDVKDLTDNITISWCKFTYLKAPRAGGPGGTDDHRFSNLIGSGDTDKPSDGKFSITWQYCWWASGCVERMTRARNSQLDFVNCYWNSSVTKYALGLGGVTDCYIENSIFANSGTTYKYYDNGTVRMTSVGCTKPPANVGSCPAPSHTREAIAGSLVVNAITGSCGAGATLDVTSSGVISAKSSCSGTVANIAPTVSITAPANNATYTAPASFTITADAADSDGSISKVEFYNGTTLLTSDNSSPYSYSWTGVAAGTYSITAKATDNSGAVTTSTAISVKVNAPANVLPTVSVTAPINNATYTAPASVTVTANAADSDGTISKVDFYSGTTLLGSDATSPYSYSWTGVAGGTYSITAKATDNSGGVTTSASVTITVNAVVGNAVPTVSITSPAYNAPFTAPATVTITADAADSDGTISKVEFYNGTTLLGSDATAPYSYSWTGVVAGSYSITAKATDNLGAVTTSSAMPVVVNQPAGIAPTVSITSPANNATYTAPASVTVTADAADADGTISKVDFYNGTTLLGSDATAPYSYNWTGVAAGTYSITAKATDNSSAVTTSSAINITVNSLPGSSITIQAETACAVDGILLETKNAGFNGAGYVNVDNLAGTAITWLVNAQGSQTTDLTIRFANGGTANRDMSLEVNGTVQVATVSLPSTGAWTTWSTVVVQVVLLDGANTIKVISLGVDGGPNVDELTYASSFITAGNCSQPMVKITGPANNVKKSAPASIAITADASDADGTVSKVEFYNGATLLGTDVTAPYSYDWTITTAGTYSITAKATDNGGVVTTSEAVNIEVTGTVTGIISADLVKSTEIFPNPSAASFNVRSTEVIASLTILNLIGEVVYTKENIAAGIDTEIESGVKDGTYLIQILYQSGAREMKKFVKIK